MIHQLEVGLTNILNSSFQVIFLDFRVPHVNSSTFIAFWLLTFLDFIPDIIWNAWLVGQLEAPMLLILISTVDVQVMQCPISLLSLDAKSLIDKLISSHFLFEYLFPVFIWVDSRIVFKHLLVVFISTRSILELHAFFSLGVAVTLDYVGFPCNVARVVLYFFRIEISHLECQALLLEVDTILTFRGEEVYVYWLGNNSSLLAVEINNFECTVVQEDQNEDDSADNSKGRSTLTPSI